MTVESLTSRCLAEFVGTFVLVATVFGNVLAEEPVFAGVSIGCALAVMIYCMGRVSGGHLNPAVSLACGLSRHCPLKDVAAYMVSQVLGGIAAGLYVTGMYGGKGITLKPVGEHAWWQAGIAEFAYTAMLCFVVLNVAFSKAHHNKGQFYGIAIGFTVIAGAYGAGNVSMGCFNPAVAAALDFSSAIITGTSPTFYSPVYIGFELLAAVLAAGLDRVLRPEDFAARTSAQPSEAEAEAVEKSSMPCRLLSEFLGTYMLVLTVSLNVLTKSPAAAFSIGCSLMCMIFALGTVSGAHFNPAVTTAVVASGRSKCPLLDGCAYILIQLLAGVAASFSAGAVTGKAFESLKPAASEWYQVIMAEALFTAVLAFTVVSVATISEPLTQYFGFAIGMCVTIGGFAIGGISGGSLNPAVSLGIAAKARGSFLEFVPYALVELAAGLLAAGVFRMIQPLEYMPVKEAVGGETSVSSDNQAEEEEEEVVDVVGQPRAGGTLLGAGREARLARDAALHGEKPLEREAELGPQLDV